MFRVERAPDHFGKVVETTPLCLPNVRVLRWYLKDNAPPKREKKKKGGRESNGRYLPFSGNVPSAKENVTMKT